MLVRAAFVALVGDVRLVVRAESELQYASVHVIGARYDLSIARRRY
jgi:hypothetical protein